MLSFFLGVGLFLFFIELIFRLALPVSDIPYWVPDGKQGYRHPPGLEGWFVTASHTARFRLNNRGWNSREDYTAMNTWGGPRIAIVGDSFVEALQVDVGRGIGPQLTRFLAERGARVQIYTYGISGASTAYALELLQSEVLLDRPNIIVYLFINNDVADNVTFLASGNRPGPHFDLDSEGHLKPLPLVEYAPKRSTRLLSKSAIFRYFWVNRGLGTSWQSGTLLSWLLGRDVSADEGQEAVYAAEDANWRRAWEVTGALIERMNDQAHRMGAEFLVINRPHPANFYPASSHGDINRPETRLSELSRGHSFLFIDLKEYFQKDWAAYHERFDYPEDAHWNERGHEVAALALRDIISTRWPEILQLGPRPQVDVRQ